MSTGVLWRTCFLRKFYKSFTIFRDWAKFFRHRSKVFSAGLSKLLFGCPEVPFVWKKFLAFFLSFSNNEQKIYGVLSSFLLASCQNCYVHVHRNVLGKNAFFPKHFFVTLGHWVNFFWPFVKSFPPGSQNRILLVHRNHTNISSWDDFPKRLYHVGHFRTSWEIFSSVCLKRFGRVVKRKFF